MPLKQGKFGPDCPLDKFICTGIEKKIVINELTRKPETIEIPIYDPLKPREPQDILGECLGCLFADTTQVSIGVTNITECCQAPYDLTKTTYSSLRDKYIALHKRVTDKKDFWKYIQDNYKTK